MKSNKLIVLLFASSVVFNIILLFSSSDEARLASPESDTATLYQQFNNNATNVLFEQDGNFTDLDGSNSQAAQIQVLQNKIKILANYNKTMQSQIEQDALQQQAIITALDAIADKIDSQFLMPTLDKSNNQDSSYGLNFNAIPRNVIKQCLQVTADASATIRQQQRQSREQLLESEDADDSWTSKIETQINSVLANQQLQNSELISLNCRTTICQIKIQHNSLAAKKLFEGPFFKRFQQNVSQYDERYDKETKQSTGIFYLTRSKEN